MNKSLPWISVSLCLWVFTFWDFLNSHFALTSDAISYYDHTRFFVVNLAHGHFPFWDPFWCNGAPNDFFLRRIGAFNPLYLFILVLYKIGLPYTLAYLWSLGIYYMGGMIAFYLLAKRLYNNQLIAYAGFLILLFSALGTRLFDSYMMLVTVPLIWFFYFLVAFSQKQEKYLFLGLILSLMILLGTYIPFYFLLIFGLFVCLYIVLYGDQIFSLGAKYYQFIKQNKLLFFLSLAAIVLSLFPLVKFFLASAKGQVVLPIRHGSSGAGLTVPIQTVDWGAVEDFFYSYYFSNLRLYKFAVVYVPFFSIILIALGFIGKINRRTIFLFLWGAILACCIIPHGLPFYNFLYNHLFILRFFRNLHFFIWFFLIPLFVFLALEHWYLFAQIDIKNRIHRWWLLAYVVLIHVFVFVFIWLRHDAIISTYFTIILSCFFWICFINKRIKANFGWMAFLTVLILIQPLETYHYFILKSEVKTAPYTYDDIQFNHLELNDYAPLPPQAPLSSKGALYYASAGYNSIYDTINAYALAKYLQHKFILVDHIQSISSNGLDSSVLERHFINQDNVAYVNSDSDNFKITSDDPNPSDYQQPIVNVSDSFKILSFSANSLSLMITLPYEKFLVYNDSFDPSWHVHINHHPEKVYQTNGAFKGVWLPAGESLVEFHFGSWIDYVVNILLTVIALLILLGICWYGIFGV